MTTPQPAYIAELLRHFADLRDGTHGDATSRRDKEQLFTEAVSLLDPYARQALNEINAHLLLGTGKVTATGVRTSASGGVDAVWALSWPEQRATGINPIVIDAFYGSGFHHPHLRGGTLGDWPLNVFTRGAGRRPASHAARHRRCRPAQPSLPTRLPDRSRDGERTTIMTPRLSIQVSLPCVESARIEETALRPMSSVKRRQNVHLAPAVHDANRRLARDQYVEPSDMLAELAEDNKTLAARLREAHKVCDDHCDLATASLIEVWIDDTERRTWFFSEVKRGRQQ